MNVSTTCFLGGGLDINVFLFSDMTEFNNVTSWIYSGEEMSFTTFFVFVKFLNSWLCDNQANGVLFVLKGPNWKACST